MLKDRIRKAVGESYQVFFDCLGIDYRNNHIFENSINKATDYLTIKSIAAFKDEVPKEGEINKLAISLADEYSMDATDPVRNDIYEDSKKAIEKICRLMLDKIGGE